MKFSLKNDSMCYNDAYLMTSRAIKLAKAKAGHGYKARKWEYFAIPGYCSDEGELDDESYFYTITRMNKDGYAEIVGIYWV